MMVAVRPARDDDAAAAVDLVRRSIRELCTADHRGDQATLSRWLANKTVDNFFKWLANPDNFCVVAESDRWLAGVGLLHRGGELRLFYVAPGAQRLGAGRLIHAALEQQAHRWNLVALHLDSTALACRFYEALGYRPAGPAKPLFGVLRCMPYQKPLQEAARRSVRRP